MRHGVKRIKLNRNMGERKALMRSLLVALFTHEKIVTTQAKAKAVRPMVDHFIARARKNDVATKRLLLSQLPNQTIIEKLMQELAPRYSDRVGGYSRIVPLGKRMSDSSMMARLELVGAAAEKSTAKNQQTPAKSGASQSEDRKLSTVQGKGTKVKTQGKVVKAERTGKILKEKAVSRRQVSTQKEGKK